MKPRKPLLQSARLLDQRQEDQTRYFDYSQSTGKVYLYRLLDAMRAVEKYTKYCIFNTQLNLAL